MVGGVKVGRGEGGGRNGGAAGQDLSLVHFSICRDHYVLHTLVGFVELD